MSDTKKKREVPKWLLVSYKVVEWAIIVFIVICMLNLLSQKMVGQTPSLFGYSIYTVVTPSMEPAYKVGDVVICKNIKAPEEKIEEFKVDDVIAFVAPDGFQYQEALEGHTVTHRIVEAPYYDKTTDTYYVKTKGDNAPKIDNVPIPVENIKGKIVGTNVVMTTIVSFVSKWYGFVTVIVTPLLIVLILQVRVLVKEKEKEKIKQLEEEKQAQLKELLQQIEKQIEEKDGPNE